MSVTDALRCGGTLTVKEVLPSSVSRAVVACTRATKDPPKRGARKSMACEPERVSRWEETRKSWCVMHT